jgi:hypothetical protein
LVKIYQDEPSSEIAIALFTQPLVKITIDLLEEVPGLASIISQVQTPLILNKALTVRSFRHLSSHISAENWSKVVINFYSSQVNTHVEKEYAIEISKFLSTLSDSEKSMHLERALEAWSSRRLISIGSDKQHVFLTYIWRQLLTHTQKLTDRCTTFIREGIKLRMDSSKECMKLAHVLWDTFAESMGVEDRMLTKEDIQQFDSWEEAKQEKKVVEEAKETVIPPMCESDSDDESDFEGFEVEKDDLEGVTKIKKPMHIYDLVAGLQSEGIDRYHLALETASELIKKNLPSMDVMLEELLQILFRTENKFNKDDFEILKSNAIRSWIYVRPAESSKIIFSRLSYREASLGHKIKLLGLLQDAIKELANTESPSVEFTSLPCPSKSTTDFNEFFSPPSNPALSKAEEIKNLRIESNTIKKLSYHIQPTPKAKKNLLLSVSSQILYPLLAIPAYSDTYMVFLDEKDLTISFLKTISVLLYNSINSPSFEEYVKETWDCVQVFMNKEDSQVRKQLWEVYTTWVLGTKGFMLKGVSKQFGKVRGM